MLLIRRFEEKVEERFRAGELPGFLHVAIGQEAVAMGVCRALEDGRRHRLDAPRARAHDREGDASERGHGRALRQGRGLQPRLRRLDAPLRRRAREPRRQRGRRRRPARDRSGPRSRSSAREPRVAVAFFGDGATNIGTFHESLNLAQLWKVPAVFVCENNHYAESTPYEQHSDRGPDVARAEAFGMTAMQVDGQDVEAVYQAAPRRSSTRARRGPA